MSHLRVRNPDFECLFVRSAGWLGPGQVVVVVCLAPAEALATDNDTSTQSIHLTR